MPAKKAPKPRTTKRKAKAAPVSDHLESLNYRQRLFVACYLGQANGNATEAACLAGYASPNVQGPRLLVHVGIQAAINAKLAEVAMSAAEVLARLSDLAAADLGDFVTLTKAGKPTIDLRRAQAAGKLHLIRSLKPTKYGLSIELHDSQSALDKLARYHGLFRGERADTGLNAAEIVQEMTEAAERYELEHPDEESGDCGGAGEVPDGPGPVQ